MKITSLRRDKKAKIEKRSISNSAAFDFQLRRRGLVGGKRGKFKTDLKLPEFHLNVCYLNLPFMTENPEMVLSASSENLKISIFCTREINATSNACISI